VAATDARRRKETLARNFINSLERIPQTIEQYKKKNASLAKDIPLLKEIANKQWKKEDELKGLKSELATLDRKIQLKLTNDTESEQREQQIQLELTNDTESEQREQQKVANGDERQDVSNAMVTPSKRMQFYGNHY